MAELKALLADPEARVFAMEVSDRFGNHGLVGAAVIRNGEIVGLVMSCRVLGVEHEFMRHIIDALAAERAVVSGAIIETARNIPVRHIFRDHGFVRDDSGVWRLRLGHARATADRAVA